MGLEPAGFGSGVTPLVFLVLRPLCINRSIYKYNKSLSYCTYIFYITILLLLCLWRTLTIQIPKVVLEEQNFKDKLSELVLEFGSALSSDEM